MSIDEFKIESDRLSDMGYSIIEKYAREVMLKDKRITSFTMAMGTWFFEDYDNVIIDAECGRSGDYGLYKYFRKSLFKPLIDFLDEHDESFKFTGMPMHFREVVKL